jgi:hypothetical protein
MLLGDGNRWLRAGSGLLRSIEEASRGLTRCCPSERDR